MMYPQQISYKGYLALGGCQNKALYSKAVYIGSWFSHWTYWYNPFTCEAI